MADQIEGVVPSDPQVKMFYNILKGTYADLGKTMTGDISSQPRQRAIMNQIGGIFDKADKDVKAWIKVEVPTFYENGMYQATQDLNNRGSVVRIDSSFASFHQQAVEAIAQDTYASVQDGLQGISRTATRLISQGGQQAIMERLAKGVVTGDARRKIEKDLVQTLKDEGITAITDRRGRAWDLLDYAEMLSRTKLTQAYNSGTANRMIESGYDLVVVSNHFGSCPLCAPFDGQVLSLTGRNAGYTSLAHAQAAGLFHPNCRHIYTPYHKSYLDQSVAWDTYQQKYVPYNDLTIKKTAFPVNLTHEVSKDDNADTIVGSLARQKIRETEINIQKFNTMKDAHEVSYVIDAGGNVIADKSGSKNEVAFTKAEAMAMKDSVLIHNHPNDTVFSRDDIVMAAKADLKEIRAVGVTNTYSMVRPDGGWPIKDMGEFVQTANTAAVEVKKDFENYDRGSQSKFDFLQYTYTPAYFRKIAEKLGAKFSVIKNK